MCYLHQGTGADFVVYHGLKGRALIMIALPGRVIVLCFLIYGLTEKVGWIRSQSHGQIIFPCPCFF